MDFFKSESTWAVTALTRQRIDLLRTDPVMTPTARGVLIVTVFGRLDAQGTVKRDWVLVAWHLGNRLLRNVLMQTVAVWLNTQADHPPLQLAHLVG